MEKRAGAVPIRRVAVTVAGLALAATLTACTDDAVPPVGTAPPATGTAAASVPATVPPTAPPTPSETARTVRAPMGSAPAGPSGPVGVRPPHQAVPRGQASIPPTPRGYDPARHLTHLTVHTDGLVLKRPVGGVRHGTLVVTIRNTGRHAVWGLRFNVEVPESMSADGGDWSGCTRLASTRTGYPAGSQCRKGYLAAGASRTFRLGMKSPASKDNSDSLVSRWMVYTWSGGPGDVRYRDAGDAQEATATFLVTRV